MSICVIVSFDPSKLINAWFPLFCQHQFQSYHNHSKELSWKKPIGKKMTQSEGTQNDFFFFEYVHLVLYLWVWSFPFFPFPVSPSLPPARCVDLSVIRNSCPFMGLSGHLNVVRHRVTSDSINGPEAITNSAYIMSNSAVARPAVTSRVCGHLLCHLQLYESQPAPAGQTQHSAEFCCFLMLLLFCGSTRLIRSEKVVLFGL